MTTSNRNISFIQYMDEISELIKKSERRMQQLHYIKEVVHENLHWMQHDGKMRICYADRPLIEHPFELREKLYTQIPDLVRLADHSMRVTDGEKSFRLQATYAALDQQLSFSASLTETERLTYYQHVCDSLGLKKGAT